MRLLFLDIDKYISDLEKDNFKFYNELFYNQDDLPWSRFSENQICNFTLILEQKLQDYYKLSVKDLESLEYIKLQLTMHLEYDIEENKASEKIVELYDTFFKAK
jgi:hypothetical protein